MNAPTSTFLRPARTSSDWTAPLQSLAVVLLAAGAATVTFRNLSLGGNFLLSDLLVLAGGGVLMVARRRLRWFPATDPAMRIVWFVAVALLLEGLGASTLINGAAANGLVGLTQYLVVLVWMPLVMANLDETQLTRVALAYIVGVLAVTGLGIVIYFFFPVLAKPYAAAGRLRSFMGDPNAFAKTIALTLPLCGLFWEKRSVPRPLLVGVIATLAGGVLVSASFGGAAAAGVAVFTFVLMTRSPRRVLSLTAAGAALVGGFLAIFGLPEVFVRRVIPALTTGNLNEAGSFVSREAIAAQAVEWLQSSPFIGLGLDGFRVVSDSQRAAHNTFLLIWVEGGLPAMVGWLMVFLVLLLAAVQTGRRPEARSEAAALWAVLATFLVSALSSTHMYSRFWYMSLWIIFALAARARANGRVPRRRRRATGGTSVPGST